jgi:hypothetical protein
MFRFRRLQPNENISKNLQLNQFYGVVLQPT